MSTAYGCVGAGLLRPFSRSFVRGAHGAQVEERKFRKADKARMSSPYGWVKRCGKAKALRGGGAKVARCSWFTGLFAPSPVAASVSVSLSDGA